MHTCMHMYIYIKHCVQYFTYIILPNPLPHTSWGRCHYYPHFTDDETEKQKITQPRSRHQNQSPELTDYSASTLRHKVVLTVCQPGSHTFYTDDIVGAVIKYSHLCTMWKREPCSLSYPTPLGFSYSFRERKAFLCPWTVTVKIKGKKSTRGLNIAHLCKQKIDCNRAFPHATVGGDPVLTVPTSSFDNFVSTYCALDFGIGDAKTNAAWSVPKSFSLSSDSLFWIN